MSTATTRPLSKFFQHIFPSRTVVPPNNCNNLEKLREQMNSCLLQEDSIVTCAAVINEYTMCLRKIDASYAMESKHK